MAKFPRRTPNKTVTSAQKAAPKAAPAAKVPAPKVGTNVKVESMKREAGANRAVVLTKGAAKKSGFQFRKHVDPTGIRADAAKARKAAPVKAPAPKATQPAKTAVKTAKAPAPKKM